MHHHVTCTLHHPTIHLPLYLIPITSGGRYNLWSYISCSLLHFTITFNHKVHRLISTVPKPSLQPSLCHRISVTPTAVKMLHKDTHVYTAIISFWKEKGQQNITNCSVHFYKFISSQFLHPYVSATSFFNGVKFPLYL